VIGLAEGSSGGVTTSRRIPLASTYTRTWLGGAVEPMLSRALKVTSVAVAALNAVAVRRSLVSTAMTLRASSRFCWRVSAAAVARW
jgi:hypothetical protein